VSSHDSQGIKCLTSLSSAGRFSCLFDRRSGEVSRPQKVAQRKFSKIDTARMPNATKAYEKKFSSGHAMGLFSAGFPTGGGGALSAASAFPTNRLPIFPLGAGHKGHWEAPLLHLQLFKSSTSHSSMQTANRQVSCAVSRLPENSNPSSFLQPLAAVERPPLLWETLSNARQIRVNRASRSHVCPEKKPPSCLRFALLSHFCPLRPCDNAQIRQSVHKKLHSQRHQQQSHDSDQDTDTRLPKNGPNPSRGRQH
jgi:hypothetical protein